MEDLRILILSIFKKKQTVNFGYLNSKQHLVRNEDRWTNNFCIYFMSVGRWVMHVSWIKESVQFSRSVMSDSVTPWTAACRASLSITNSQSLLKLMSIATVMLSKPLILCHAFLLPSSIFPRIRVFSNELVLHIRWL